MGLNMSVKNLASSQEVLKLFQLPQMRRSPRNIGKTLVLKDIGNHLAHTAHETPALLKTLLQNT